MSERAEGAIAALAAIFVLLSAMLDPKVSVALSIIFLLALAVYKFREDQGSEI